MPTSTQLASGLGGAIGCDFRTLQNQLIFVEYSTGKLSALNLFPPSTIVAQGTGTVLKGTFMFDFDTGTQSVAGPISPTMDVFWDQHTATVRSMDPIQGAKIINLGAVNFAVAHRRQSAASSLFDDSDRRQCRYNESACSR